MHVKYEKKIDKNKELKSFDSLIYPEHNDSYLQECLLNLHNKGIDIVMGR